VPIYEQSAYKYLLYIDGHCAACRYAFMMRLGSVILKVESRGVADRMWYFPLLRPWVDHVPVAPDLSDLSEKILWCRSHDTECRAIAENAKALYDRFVSKEGVLDYLELFCHEIARKSEHPPAWWNPAKPPRNPPSIATAASAATSSSTSNSSTSSGIGGSVGGATPPLLPVGQHLCDGDRYCARCASEIAAHEARNQQEHEEELKKNKKRKGGGGAEQQAGGGAGGAGRGSGQLPDTTKPVPHKPKRKILKKRPLPSGSTS
jgi:hypothetical protein